MVFAAECDVAYSTLCSNATGRSSPRLDKLRVMLDRLEMDVKLVPKDQADGSPNSSANTPQRGTI